MLQDNYEHIDESVLYTTVNIAGPGMDLAVYEDQFEGCDCLLSCGVDCICMKRCGGVGFNSSGLLNVGDVSLIYECHENCTCRSESCNNRRVQKGPHPELQVMETSMKGAGLRCLKNLKKGEFVCEYAGEVIGGEEARLRYARLRPDDTNYLFALREHFGSTMSVTYVDATHIGNIGRYINHSCDPNLLIIAVRTDTAVPKLCLFANRDIECCTELTYDYGGGTEMVLTWDDDNGEGSICYCGTAVCRGKLPFDKSLKGFIAL